MRRLFAVATILFGLSSFVDAPARATQILNFRYDGNGGTLTITGSMAGVLALDGNNFIPTIWLSLFAQGNNLGTDDHIPGLVVEGLSGNWQNSVAAVVTLDGSSENFSTYPYHSGNFGALIFQTPDVNLTQNAGISVNGFGGSTWVQSQWHASIATPAPEPASLALFGLGAAALGVVRRRRAVRLA